MMLTQPFMRSPVFGTLCAVLLWAMTSSLQAEGRLAEQLIADTDAVTAAAQAGQSGLTECKKPRPEICYEIYQPVCAVRETGVRCITEPCPSEEQVTYANDCKACADQAVLRFQAGSCEDLATGVAGVAPEKVGKPGAAE